MTENTRPTGGEEKSGRRHFAGWFDIRNVIGALLLIYGIVLILMGLFGTTDSELDRADGVNANLWSGLVITAVAAFFLIWARLRPIVVDEAQVERDKREQENEPPAH
jgi:uncharacterized membrane protein